MKLLCFISQFYLSFSKPIQFANAAQIFFSIFNNIVIFFYLVSYLKCSYVSYRGQLKYYTKANSWGKLVTLACLSRGKKVHLKFAVTQRRANTQTLPPCARSPSSSRWGQLLKKIKEKNKIIHDNIIFLFFSKIK